MRTLVKTCVIVLLIALAGAIGHGNISQAAAAYKSPGVLPGCVAIAIITAIVLLVRSRRTRKAGVAAAALGVLAIVIGLGLQHG